MRVWVLTGATGSRNPTSNGGPPDEEDERSSLIQRPYRRRHRVGSCCRPSTHAGDKLETAIDIAFSAGLFTQEMQIAQITATEKDKLTVELKGSRR